VGILEEKGLTIVPVIASLIPQKQVKKQPEENET
jgi:hypothetical protein